MLSEPTAKLTVRLNELFGFDALTKASNIVGLAEAAAAPPAAFDEVPSLSSFVDDIEMPSDSALGMEPTCVYDATACFESCAFLCPSSSAPSSRDSSSKRNFW